jgi:proteasome accessory factor C
MAETSTERFTRLLTLVPWLAAHSGVSKQDAARHFGLTVAQLESDLQLITFTGPGMYGGELVDIAFEDETVTVYDAQGLNRPLELSSDEAAALLVGLHALQQLPDIDAGLVAKVTEKLAAYAGAGAALDIRVSGSPHAATIAQALRDGCDVNITYVHPLRDDAAPRRVTPIRVITQDGVDYLNGWCRTSEAFRTFRLDRMHACEVGEPSAEIPSVTGDAIPLASTAIVEIPVASEHLLEQVTCNVLERGQNIRAEVAYGDERWLIAWAIRAGGVITVIEPRPVADGVVQRAQFARDAYIGLN